jgi:hypothetical protein
MSAVIEGFIINMAETFLNWLLLGSSSTPCCLYDDMENKRKK